MNQIITCSLFTLQEKKVTKKISSILKTFSYSNQKYTQQAFFPEIEKDSLHFHPLIPHFFYKVSTIVCFFTFDSKLTTSFI